MAVTTPTESRTGVLDSLSPFHKAKLAFLAAAFVSLVLSVALWFLVDRELGLFVGLWVPAIHSLGALVLTEPRS
ncbi:MAG TPA: hypothetical protein VLG28_16620 [Acidimicrobiia bacterium]|jgi:hypothetical protein|nr:hypothetical protein [Acidimicrobiia bacterium]